jgi:(R)-citramalyl-CoA lyase
MSSASGTEKHVQTHCCNDVRERTLQSNQCLLSVKVLDSYFLAPGSWFLVLGSWFLILIHRSMTHITIIDVSPRDGLQNEPEILPVAVKVELIERLARAGLPRIEIGAFVNPKQTPQMAGTGEVASALNSELGGDAFVSTAFTALVPNLRGYELAVTSGLRHVRLVMAASEALNQANFRRSVAESLADFARIAERAQAENIVFGCALGASFGCPFEGNVPPERVLELMQQALALGADEIVLADTTGMAVPTQVESLCTSARQLVPDDHTLTVHFHNTRNTGYANAYAALQAGITSFDASLGGIGGCPFAPKAVGNIATEDLVHMLNGMGVETEIDLNLLLETSNWLSEQMGKALPALVGKAGPVFAERRVV